MSHRTFQISAVILASGKSKRMGTTKQLLPYAGVPLLEYVIRKLLPFSFSRIHTIVGHQYEEVIERIHIDDPRFHWQINQEFNDGQSRALKCAAAAVQDCDGMMVFLADQPLIQGQTIQLVLNKALEQLSSPSNGIVVQPSYLGKSGHPVFFSNHLYSAFDHLSGDEGGKRVITHAECHDIISVEDTGILFDVDTQADYQSLLKTEKSI
jgi:molybdenum cofactor cytidylyltransferase